VVTVILMLILTGVVIKVSVDGKLFGRAKEAVDKTNTKVAEIQGEVNRLLDEWDKIENGTAGGNGNTSGNGNNAGDGNSDGDGNQTGGNNTTGGGDTEPEEPIVNRSYLRVGEYVDYKPDTAEAYSLPKNITGNSINQTIEQDKNLKWRILNINEDGTVDIISEQATRSLIYFDRSSRI